MELTNKYKRLPLDEITVLREERQRKTLFDAKGNFLNSDGLLESIRDYGVLSPVLVQRTGSTQTLVFGERRYTASRLLGIDDIPVRFVDELTPLEAQILEFEENLCRSALPWRDEVANVAKLHELYCSANPGWTVKDSVQRMNYSQVPQALRVARDLWSPRIAEADSVRVAYNILLRQDERAVSDALSDIMDASADIMAPLHSPAEPVVADDGTLTTLDTRVGQDITRTVHARPLGLADTPAEQSLIHGDFIAWAAQYAGPKFNLIHCDFPYGQSVFNGPQSGKTKWETYDDQASNHEALIRALCTHLDRLMSHSGHLMFWCSADFERQAATVELFRRLAPSLVFDTFPLVWHKTDNVGVLPDPKRGPRRVTETALIAAREDRLIVRAVSNAYGAPTDKSLHPSCKPEPVLRHFFSMFVDEHTRMLDPTCGSGTALRAAESLGAAQVLGLESSQEHYEGALKALRQFRSLRKATR